MDGWICTDVCARYGKWVWGKTEFLFTHNPSYTFHAGLLLSAEEFVGKSVGVAYIGTVCRGDRYGVAE
jgi:hypothetical protein